MRRQKTFRHVIGCVGVGLHSGARVGLTLRPAEAGSGIRFRRVDRLGSSPIPARLDHVVEAQSTTSLGRDQVPTVRMIEHLMGAFAACEIDNALVEISGPELPLMDGSAQPFVLLIECAGTMEQDAPVAELEVLEPVAVSEGGRYARLEPAAGLQLSLAACARSKPFAFSFSPEAAKRELVAARAGAHGADLRYDDEEARHAALDALGDLALIPARLQARYVASGADAPLRRRLMRRLLQQPDAWRLRGPMAAGVLLGAPGEPPSRRAAS